MKRLALVSLVLLVAILVAGCQGASSAKTIRIGLIAPLTGSESLFGQGYKRGVELAVKDINAKGGVLGKTVELFVEDDQNDPNQSVNAVQKLVNQNKVVGIVGAFSSKCSIPAHEQACALGVPIISPTSTNPKVTVDEKGNHKWCAFRATFIDPFQGQVAAKFAYNDLGIRKAAVFWDNGNDYSKGLAEYFINNFEALGGLILVKEAYSAGDQDFSAQITRAMQSGVELIYLPDYFAKVNLIAGQARTLGYKGKFMGGDGWDNPGIDKTILNGSYYTAHYAPEDPEAAELVAKWKAEYNGEVPTGDGALAYDAAIILLNAIERAGTTDGKKVAEAMLQTKDLRVGTAVVSINEQGNAVKPVYFLQVTLEGPKYVTKVSP
ncbi:ABC transporter substrate-binding protein [Coprothermobacteraceae bacterium]|nr:ABC transporter substrate-binding protein [Coprothermobacteraceae bacterium]